MKTITLTRGRYAMVDDDDFEWLCRWRWQAGKRKFKTHTLWYAVRVVGHRGPTKYMHREIAIHAGLPDSPKYDHRDGNGLNNQRENLRPCTESQNSQNRRKSVGKTSKFKGVAWHIRKLRWIATLAHNGKRHYLGYFKTQQSAARAYDAVAREHFGEFAVLNFP